MKVSCLSWGLHLEVIAEQRAAQGHHRLKLVNNSVVKYRRDDVLPALHCQCVILQRISQGWVPYTPLCRGAEPVQERAPTLVGKDFPSVTSDTEDSGSDGGSSSSSSSADGNGDFDRGASSLLSEDLSVDFEGPWLLNLRSGWFHKTLEVCEDGRNWSWRAVRPCALGRGSSINRTVCCHPQAFLEDSACGW